MGTASAIKDNTNNETQVLSAVNNDEIVAIDNSQEMLSAGQPATFADLATVVGNGGDKNLGGKIYTYEGGSSVIGSFIRISEPGTIDGQGAVIDANGANFRLFSVGTNNVIFKNITFKNVNSGDNGPVILFNLGGALEDCTFADNNAGSGAGGAVYFYEGEGTVKNCNFTHNTASGNHAGALYFYDVGTVINSNFIDNSASGTPSGNGGAIYFNSRGTVINSNFRGNNATTKKGGAVYFTGQGTVTGCNFTSNSASEGGAVYFENDGNVTGCNFTDNSVSTYAGAVYFKYTGMVNNSNFTNNIADKGNGAIYFSDPGSVDNSNFIHNIAKDGDGGAVYFKRSGNVTNSNFINNTALTPPQKTNGRGGAINFNNSDNAVGRVENCNFNNNSAKFIAGAIYVGKVGVILDSNFTNNFVFNGSGGGAVFFDTSSTGEIKRSNFENNNLTTGRFTQGNAGGGAVYFGGSLSSLDYCNFTNNFVSNNCSGGGAVHFENFGNITNCNFASNYVTGKGHGGGAVHLLKSANINNCNFTDNHVYYADSNGGAINDVNSNYGDMTNITNSNFYNNDASAAGGAVYIYHALGNVVGCNFTDNRAKYGGAVHFELAGNVDMSNFIRNNAISGAAVHIANITGALLTTKSLDVKNSNFTDNTATSFAGAIYSNDLSTLNVEYSNFINNHGNVGNAGGAIYTSDEGNISGSEFINNTGGAGGAIYLKSGDVEGCNFTNNSGSNGGAVYIINQGNFVNCNFVHNTATSNGSAVFLQSGGDVSGCNFTNNSGSNGGAAYITNQGNIVNSNFIHNNATSDGGAAYITGQGTVDNCNFADNIAYGKIHGGGAICIGYGDVKNSNFTNNRAYRGGAIYFLSSSNMGSVDNSSFNNCSSSGSGGAVYFTNVGSVDNSSFNNCSSTSGSGGAVFFNKGGSVDNSNFTNCSSSLSGGAVYFSNDGSVDKSIFTNSSSDSGGAVYFSRAGSVDNSNFTYNRASSGSAIYFDSQSDSDAKTVKNSILLNNKARSSSLTLVNEGSNAFITFAGNDNLLNSIYSKSDVGFDNVTYWGVYGVNNTDASSVSRSSNEIGQNITVTINHDGNVDVRDMVTDINGQVSFDLTTGHYAISAVHPDDLYYTRISRLFNEFDKYESITDLDIFDFTAKARVRPDDRRPMPSGNVLFNITNESGVVKEINVPLVYDGKGNFATLDLSDLNLGKYNITAVYNGDENFLSSNNTTSFELVRINSTIKIPTYDILVVENEEIDVTINGKVLPWTIYVNGVPYDGPNSGVSWVVSNLPVGVYTVEVDYPGDEKYLPAHNSSSFAVIENKDYYITVNDKIGLLNYPVNITAESTLPLNNLSNKELYFVIYKDGLDFDYVEPTLSNDGIWWLEYTFYTSDGFSENSNIEIEPEYWGGPYSANIYYTNGKITLRYGAPFNISAEDVDYGNKVNVTIDLPFDVEGNVTFYIGDKNYSIENMQGNPKYFIIPDIFAAGQYTVNAVYSGDTYYPSNTTTTTFNVNRATPTITINASDIVVGNNAIINATLPENATGKILLIVNGTEYEVDSGESISVPNLNVGPYEVVAIYEGDQNYTSGHAFKSFNVIKKNLTISLDEVTDKIQVGSPVTLTARLSETVTGDVVFTINDVNHTVTISNANFITYEYTPVDNSPLTVVATFPGNDRFNSNKSAPMTLTVNGIPTNVTVTFDSPVFVGNDVKITIKLNASIDTTVKLKINDTVRDVVILGGTGTYTASNLLNDTYTITATFEGNERYAENSSEPKTLKVNKVPTTIAVSTNSPIVVGETAVITINMEPSMNAIVKLRVNGKTYYVAVVNGVGSYNVSGLPANDGYDVNVTFDGDSKYLYATNNTTLVVNKITDYPINVTTENIVAGDNETITVVLPADINKDNLVIKVDGVVKNPVSVVNGVATVVVSGLTVGQHEVNVTYNDDGKYMTKNNNSNMFTVSPSPICDIALDVDNKTYGEDTTFTVTLPSDVTENVTIIIDGKDYSVKPNQGVATLTLNNLTGGLHTVIASYPGDSIYSANFTSATFVIPRAASSIDVDFTTPKSVGDDVLINVTMPQKINGTVILSVGDNNYTVDITDGNGSYVVSGLTSDIYNIKAEFKGNENYTSSVSDVKQLVIDKVPTSIVVAVNATINAGETAVVNVTIDKKLNGSAVVSVNGENHTVAIIDGNGTLTLANLASGTYTINATFKGDDQFVGSTSNTATLTVNKIAADISVSVDSPIKVGETAVVTINMDPSINATVKLRVNGKTYDVAVVNGVGTYNVSGLPANDGYDVNVTFAGDSKYLYATNNTTLVVNKISDYPINVTTENIVFGDNETITVILPADINKDNLVIKVDGVVKDPVSVVNGVATVVVPGLTVGQHEVNVTYLGDDKYEAKNNNSNMFTVGPSPNCNIVLDVDNKTYGEDTTFTVTLPSDVTENVTITVDGKDYSVKPNQGVATLTLNNLTGGLHAVTASYPGDSIYSANSTSATFVIPRAASSIDVDFTTPKSVGDDVLINVSMSQKINGTVILSVGDNNYTVAVTDGNGSYVVSGLTNNVYNIKAEFKGNENYTASGSDVKQLVIDKVPTSIAVAVNATINVGETAVVNVTIDKKLNGSAVVSVNGENHTVAIIDGNGTLALTNLANGTYNINATFKGDNQYVGSTSNTATLIVNKIDTEIDVSVKEPVIYGEDAVITVELNAPVNATVKLLVDGKEYNVALVDGKGGFNASGLVAGPHEVNVTYAGDVKYVGSKDNATFTVGSAKLTPSVIAQNVTVEQNTSFIINVPDDFNGNVSITVGDKLYDGPVETVIEAAKLTAGDKIATVKFYGDDNYEELTLNDVKFTVSRVVPDITVVIDDVTYPDKAVATVTVANNANGTVNITVDGKVFNETVVNGQATVDLTGLGAGAKVADVKFFTGDAYNDNATATTKFNINKADSTITITVDPEYVYNDTITIDLDPSYDGVVNVTINGVVYPVNNNQVVIDRIAAGDYTVIANLAGNVNYTGATNSTTFKVKQAGSNISIDVESIYKVGDDIVICLTTENITDSDAISVTINGEPFKVVNNEVTIAGGLGADKYIINAVLAGNENFTGSSDNASFEVVKNNITIDLTASAPIVVGTPVEFTATLGEKVTGDVVFTINGANYTVHVSDDNKAVYEYTPVNNETLTVVATFVGNDDFNTNSTAAETFDVDRVATSIDVSVKTPVTYGEDAVITVELNAPVNATVKLLVDGKEYNVALVDGKGGFNASGLVAGPHEVNVTYAGDNMYVGSKDNATFTVGSAKLTPSVIAQNVTVEQNTSFIINVPDDFNGNVSITVGDKLYDGPVETVIEAAKLTAGDKIATVKFYGDDNYEELTLNDVKFTVSSVVPDITVVIDDVTYPDKAVATVTVANNANGTVNITVDGKVFNETVVNGQATVDLTGLSAGAKVADVKFFTNDAYNDNATATTKFNINKADSTITITVEPEYVYNDTITIDLDPSYDGVVNVTINGVVYPVNNNQVVIDRIAAGDYTVIANLAGNVNYTGATNSTTFKVKQAGSNISIDVGPVHVVGNDIVITLNPVNITESDAISVTINGVVYPVVDKAVTILGGLGADDYVINAILAGNENYTGSSANASFKVIKNNITIDLTVSAPIVVGTPVEFTATLGEKVTGDVVFTINGANYTVHVSDDNKAVYEYTPVNNETLTVVATFVGNDDFNTNSTAAETFDVDRVATSIDVSVKTPVTYGEDAVISIELNAPINATVKLLVDGKDYDVALVDGKGGFNASGLVAGPHKVNVTYAGDNRYVGSNGTATFTIDSAQLTPSVIAQNVTVEQNTSFIIDVPDDFNGNVSITVDGNELYNGLSNILLYGKILPIAGDKTATVKFYGDSNYEELTLNDVKFTVSRIVPAITVDIDAVTYPDKAVATVTVANNANGTVNITVDGKVFKGEVKNGEGTVDLTGLGAGAKVADVEFFTDDDYNDNATASTKFNINKADSTIIISVQPEYVYNDTITIDLDPSFDGIVNVTINGVVYPVNNNQVVIDRIAAGDYTVIANLAGNANYTGATNSTTFKVKQAGSNISIGVEPIYKVGDDIVINLTTVNITDVDAISVTVDGNSYDVRADGTVVISGGLKAGEHIINAIFAGNQNYTGSSANAPFEVIKLNTSIFIYATTPREVGSPFDIGAVLGNHVTGDVIFTINGVNYTVSLVDDWIAVIEYTPINNDTVNVVATFKGDDNYNNISSSNDFNVDKVATNIEVTVKEPVNYGEDAVISIELNAPVNATVILTVDGKDYDVALVDGKGGFNASGLGAGPHEVNVTYAGDNKYVGSNDTAAFTVEKADLTAKVTAQNVTVEQDTSFVIDVTKDFNGNVSITADNKELYNGPADTIVNGIKLLEGDKTATVKFYGDSNYEELTLNDVKFTVSRVTPEINAKINDVTYPDKAVATVTVSNNANGTVEITVDGKKFTKEVKNGKATVELTGLDAGDKVAEVQFITGDDYNNNASTTAKFTVNKADTPISLEVEEGIVGELTNITVEIDAPGIVSVKVNDTIVYVGPVEGSVVIPVSGLTAGDYDVVAEYYGDNNHKANSTSDSFTVGKNSTYNFDATPTVENQTLIIDIDLPDDATGNITVTINDENITVPVTDTIALDLKPGTYDVNVTYNGDDKYEPKTKELGNITIPTIDDYDIVIESNGTDLIITLPEDINGEVTVDIDGNETVVPVVNGTAVVPIDDLEPGDHDVTVTYPGDDKYSPNSNETTINVPTIDDYDIVIESNGTDLIITLPEDVNGEVTVDIDGNETVVPVVNGTAVVPIDDLEPGDHDVTVTYPGDDKYSPNSNETTINVPTIDDYPFVVDAVVNGSDADITVTLPDDIDGVVLIDVDDVGYYANATDGKAKLHLSDLPDGIHNVTAKFLGDDKYSPNENSTSFNTSGKVTPDMDVKVDVPNKSITVELPDDATGNVTATIDGKDYTAPIVDGKAVIPLDDLEPGDYEAEITYPGDDKYAPADKNTTFTVPRIDDYDINITAEDDNVVITLPEDINGKAKVNIDGKDYTVDVVNGTAVVPNVAPGNHDVTVTYPGDDKYAPKTANATVFISGVIITVNDLVKYYSGPQKLNVSVTDTNGKGIANKLVRITINGITYTRTTKSDGSASLPINLNVGNYTAHIEVDEYKFSKDVNVEVKHTIFGSDVVKVFRNGTHYYALFLDGYGNPLVNASVSFNIHGVFYTRTTNASGWAKLNIFIEKGEYILTALNTVTGEMASNLITVYTQLETQDLVKYYRNGTQFICRVVAPDKSYAGAGERVDFNIHGRLYTRYTNATGHISLNIDIEPGEYHITSYYQYCREGNKIIVLPVLSADDLSMKYRDGSKFIAKVVDGQGNPYPNRVVTFNINGVFYNRTTNSNGEAKLNINLQPGQYIITSTYDECSISNRITIRN